MNGQLKEHPLPELIREITVAELSGALRLERQRVKLVIYFEDGELRYAASNLRVHRLSEVLKRARAVTERQLSETGSASSETELEAALLRRGIVSDETIARARANQAAEVLRTALLWTSGAWGFDPRARLAEDVRVSLKLDQLLMESARHLPDNFVAARLNGIDEVFSRSPHATNGAQMLPVEAFVLSRVQEPVTLSQLAALSGVAESDALRAIYALTLGGLLERSAWPTAFSPDARKQAASLGKAKRARPKPATDSVGDIDHTTDTAVDEAGELNALFERLGRARNHFEVLGVGRSAGDDEVKRSYHALARRFHPDRFHQSDAGLRARVESAFARIAQAYETLGDPSLRAAYELRLGKKQVGASDATDARGDAPHANVSDAPILSRTERAESAFQRGLAAMQRNQRDAAVSCFAEAAHLEPRKARFRSQYGKVLAGHRDTRRLAETELQAAVALEPNNAAYRILLAELYRNLGLHRRSQRELERALMAEPKNKEARTMLALLQQEQ